jgi:F-box and leucine-rich repeat protein GRR1
MSATPSQHGAGPAGSAASSSPSSPEPVLDDDADSFVLQHSNESQSSLGATSSRESSADPAERRIRPKAPIENLPPEILIIILQKLNSPHDLYHSLLVCKKWARCAIDLLWHRPLFTDWGKLTKVAHAIEEPESTWPYADMVKRLNLSNLNAINDGTLQPFAKCKRIERLTLTGCANLTDQGIINLVEGNRNLLALDITGINFITDSTVQALAKNCPKLQGLNITGCHQVTDSSLVPLARACKYLKRVSGCDSN